MPAMFVEKPCPTLFIGLGGTGHAVLLRLRHRILASYGPEVFQYARFLVIDTDARAPQLVDMTDADCEAVRLQREEFELVECGLRDVELHQIRDEQQARGTWPWLHPDVFNCSSHAFQDGSGTIRQVGRLAFALKHRHIRECLKEHLRRLRADASNAPNANAPNLIQVACVTSLAGGTGSGMFLDLANLIRDIFQSEDEFFGLQHRSTLLAVLPQVFAVECGVPQLGERFQANCYAALMELEHAMTRRDYDPLWDSAGLAYGPASERFHPVWSPVPVQGRPWDHCYLIDNINDLTPGRNRNRSDVLGMISDFLYAGLGSDRLAADLNARRAAYAHIQDLVIFNEVRSHRQFGGQLADAPNGKVIYSKRHSCHYRSFGVARIQLDLERVVRAASIRLASRLVRREIRRLPIRTESELIEIVLKDFFGTGNGSRKPDESSPSDQVDISFSPSTLPFEFLCGAGRDWFQSIEESFAAAAAATPQTGEKLLTSLIEHHNRNLDRGPGPPHGAAHLEMEMRLRELRGTSLVRGLCHQQMRRRVLDRLDNLGCEQTAQYLEICRTMFQQVAVVFRKRSSVSSSDGLHILARLREAGTLPVFPFNCRKIAVNHEYGTACERAREWVLERYWGEACRFAEMLAIQMIQFIDPHTPLESPIQDASPVRLLNRYKPFLTDIGSRLDAQFAQIRIPADGRRQQGLMPEWDDAQYDREIWRTLQPDLSGCESLTPEAWGQVEQAVLAKMVGDENVVHRTIGELLRSWVERSHSRTQHEAVERVADGCYHVLRDRFRFENFNQGIVQDHLRGLSADARHERWGEMVLQSAPYFPLAQPLFNMDEILWVYGAVLGWSTSDVTEAEPRGQLWNELNQISLQKTGRSISAPSDSDPCAIVDIREVAGLPAWGYSRLPQLRQHYRSLMNAPFGRLCHLDARTRSDDSLEALSLQEEAWIRDSWQFVLLGIVTRAVQFGSRGFCAEVPLEAARVDGGFVTYFLGRRWDTVLRNACLNENVRSFLERHWTRWQVEANATRFAVLYSALWQSLALVAAQSVPIHTPARKSPLQNGLDILLQRIQSLLVEMGDDGPAWLSMFNVQDHQLDHNHSEWKAGQERVGNLIRERCLRRADPGLLIWHVHEEGLASLSREECRDLFGEISGE